MVCHGEQEAFIILRHTVEMLKDLHKKIVVEGVETQEMVDILSNHLETMQILVRIDEINGILVDLIT